MKVKRTPPQRRLFDSRELALIILLSALGAVISVPVGHAGNFLKTLALPPGASQLLAGIRQLRGTQAVEVLGGEGQL